jgi:RHS repeat-associated protein
MTTVQESGTTTLATYTYDPLSRRTNLAFDGGGAMAYTYSPGSDLLTLDHSIPGTGSVPHYTLTYTSAHQLLSEASSDSTYVWQPSAATTDSYTAANKLNQYPSWTAQGSSLQSFTYDLNGNLTSGSINGASWAYTYDQENRLINAVTGAGVNAVYAYDPLGRRNHKIGTGVTETYFLDDVTDEIAEYDATGTPVNRFVPGPSINEPAAQVIVSGNHRRFFLTDHHGSTVAMVNASGNQVEGPYVYDSYGDCFSGVVACSSSGTPYRFVGMRFDPETGLYFDRARYYSSALGRFYQVDPVGYTADLNLYTYGGNDPTDKADPSGLLDPGEKWATSRNSAGPPPSPFEDPLEREMKTTTGAQRFAQRWGRLAGTVQTALAIAQILHSALDQNAKEKIMVFRLYGGKADLFAKDDSVTGTFFMPLDPRTEGNAETIRQLWSINKDWGNDLSKIAIGWVPVSDISSAGTTRAVPGKNGTEYRGGGPEVVVINARQKVQIVHTGPSGIGQTLHSPDEGTCIKAGISCQIPP